MSDYPSKETTSMKYLRNAVVVIAVMMSACQQEQNQSSPAAVAPPEPVKVTPLEAVVDQNFPAGFRPTFEHRIRSKRTDTQDGAEYRKLVVEFKSADAQAVDKEVQSGLEEIGYRRYKTIQEANGALVGDYGREGHRITVTTTPLQPDMKLFDADSRGTVYFVWKS
jgi:hypothetical protein